MRYITAKYAEIALFAVVSLAPLAALITGETPPYGRPHPAYPAATELLDREPGAFDALGEAVLHRSPATRAATSLRNGFAYHVLKHVDAAKVVSGRDGWLFYKPELGGGRCLSEQTAVAAARRLAVLADLTRTAGMTPLFSMSADKSAVYPERLAVWVKRKHRCREQNTRVLREALAAEAPELIDHTARLWAEKASHPERLLYLKTDTHWTPYGAALAVRDLAQALDPEAGTPAPRTQPSVELRSTDLRNGMLLLDEDEPFFPLDRDYEAAFLASVRPQAERTVVIHDSFYATLKEPLAQLFPDHTLVHIESEDPLGPLLADARWLVINSVERALAIRALSGPLSTDAQLYGSLLNLNRERAKRCEGHTQVEPTRVHDVDRRGAHLHAVGPDPYAVVEVDERSAEDEPCLRLTVEASGPVTLELFLPLKEKAASVFRPDRSLLVTLEPGELNLVLPRYVRGRGVRVDVADGSPEGTVIHSLAVGTLRTVSAENAP